MRGQKKERSVAARPRRSPRLRALPWAVGVARAVSGAALTTARLLPEQRGAAEPGHAVSFAEGWTGVSARQR